MSIPLSPRAAVCTLVVLASFGWAAVQQLPAGVFGWTPMEREGRLPLTHGGAASPDDQRDIIGAVLLYEARRASRQNVCLRLAPEGFAFEQEKHAIRGLEQQLAEEPGARGRIAPELDRLRNPQRRWLLPTATGADEPPLTVNSAQQLRAAETAMLGAPAAGAVDLTLNLADFPQFQGVEPRCNPLLFTAPAVAGEIAFVDTLYRCGPRCEESWLYAIVRRESGWEVGALARR